ncbi:MAG: DUF3800 domain-containing protein [Anaerolinea sp.]|nr:DUF3800 domain-containing protein [Anaerolinea sp.]
MSMQMSFLPTPEIKFNCYHDESGTYAPNAQNGGEQWLFHGILLVPQSKQPELITQLRAVRQHSNHFGELHYRNLRKPSGPIVTCAKGWLQTYLNYSQHCCYHCLAINTHSPQFDHNRFSEPYHCYNYYARTAIVSAIAWSLAGYHVHVVNLRIFSDPKRRSSGDNFTRYVPSEVQRTIQQKKHSKPAKYPTLSIAEEVCLVTSDPQKVEESLKDECELIQLADLLTSNIAQAIKSSSDQKGKIALALLISEWIADTRKPPWLQTNELHRRFSISCFPDENGSFYDAALSIKEKTQPTLFNNLT